MGSATAMIWASDSLNRELMFVRPWPPHPTMAMLTFSLGGTNRGPPKTWRGTMVKAAIAPDVAPINFLRLRRPVEGWAFFTLSKYGAPQSLSRPSWKRRRSDRFLVVGSGPSRFRLTPREV